MPIQACTFEGKSGFRWGAAGKCFTYPPDNDSDKRNANQRAIRQGLAIEGRRAVALLSEELNKKVPGSITSVTGGKLTAIAEKNVLKYFDALKAKLPFLKMARMALRILGDRAPGVLSAEENKRMDVAVGKIVAPIAKKMRPEFEKQISGPLSQSILEGEAQVDKSLGVSAAKFADTSARYTAGSFTRPVPEEVLDWVTAHAGELSVSIEQETRATLAHLVRSHLEQGISTPRLAADIQKAYPHLVKGRAALIAHQETAMAMSYGSLSRSIDRGAREKRALTQLIGVRPLHTENAAAGWIAIDREFPGTGGMTNPFDLNCRCTVATKGAKLLSGTVPRRAINFAPVKIGGEWPAAKITQLLADIGSAPIGTGAFVPAKTVKEAEAYALRYSDSVQLNGIRLDQLNDINEGWTDIWGGEFDIKVRKMDWQPPEATSLARTLFEGKKSGAPAYMQFQRKFAYDPQKSAAGLRSRFDRSIDFRSKKLKEPNQIARMKRLKRWVVAQDSQKPLASISAHEASHVYMHHFSLQKKWDKSLIKNKVTAGDGLSLSEYSGAEAAELFAEAFSALKTGRRDIIPPRILKALKDTLPSNVFE